ncbi:MAG: DNA repair protein RadA [Candidatus Pacebacteria bacterium]|nr:DNA repair protein RadA [Candidatus Paceibacterota bacterium]
MKEKSVFVCQSCGNDTPKWAGKCPFCGEWNTLVETSVAVGRGKAKRERKKTKNKPQKLSEVKNTAFSRIKTGLGELDRVLGGGLVPGSVILLAGEPGIGKSTLVLQLAEALAGKSNQDDPGLKNQTVRDRKTVLYVSGEESLAQIKIRADRLELKTDKGLYLSETDVEMIGEQIRTFKPEVAIIDSIQTLSTDDLAAAAGSVSQIRETAARLIRMAKDLSVSVILIGHVTKEGVIAGPKILEHMVDAVITLEGEKFANFRVLRATKNRFGATSEVGIFEMTDRGMIEVSNPSKVMIEDRVRRTPGSVIVPAIEGTRPVLVEVQALVVNTNLPVPRRVARGVDFGRLQLITAVLSKTLGLRLGNYDILVNVAGGIKIQDPGADLGVALAIYSSLKNKNLPAKTAVFGELGLLGELRPVYQAQQRIKEAQRLGFNQIISSEKFSSIKAVVASLRSN